jgi:hypothetical protein
VKCEKMTEPVGQPVLRVLMLMFVIMMLFHNYLALIPKSLHRL